MKRVDGGLPQMLSDGGFAQVRERGVVETVYGTLGLYSAVDGTDASRPPVSAENNSVWNREDFVVRDLHGKGRAMTDFGVYGYRKPEQLG